MSVPTPLQPLIADLTLDGPLPARVTTFLVHHNYPHTITHSAQVAAEASRLASHFGIDTEQASHAGWLHDVSVVIPNRERVSLAHQLGLPVLPEEAAVPLLVHQKLSRMMAHHLFHLTDETVLSAIGCHTTLKAGAGPLDKLLFLADKIAWDRPGNPPYRAALLEKLAESLEAGVHFYLTYLWERRTTLLIVHPWLRAAYEELATP